MNKLIAIALGLFFLAVGTAITTAEFVAKDASQNNPDAQVYASLFLMFIAALYVAYGLTKK